MPGELSRPAIRRRRCHRNTSLLLRLLALIAISLYLESCDLLQPPPEAPFLVTRATFSRSYPEERHLLALRLRTRRPELRPDRLTLRFRLSAEIDQDASRHAAVEAAGALQRLTEQDYELVLPFDSPFPFVSRTPLRLTELTLLTVEREGRTLWRGELRYPYPVEEELSVRGSFQKR